MLVNIIFNDSYPYGRANTNRVHYFAKGLKAAGNEVEILLHRPTEIIGRDRGNKLISGIYDGVCFKYAARVIVRNKNFWLRRYYDVKGMLITAIHLINKRKSIGSIILFSKTFSHIVFYKVITKVCGIVYLSEQGELPFIYRNKTPLFRIYSALYLRLAYKMFDGVIAISENLSQYLKDKIGKNGKIIVIPALTDMEEIDRYKVKNKSNTIVYAGSLCQKKDGIKTLLIAFARISGKIPDINLVVIGNTNSGKDLNVIQNLISEFNIKDRVIFTGFISRMEMIQKFKEAKLLVFAKPKSIEAEYCFPSKLVEYLATGTPVLTTKIGEAKRVITDCVNGYLSEPDDSNSFATRILSIIYQYDYAVEVGIKGRDLAAKEFSYTSNMEILSDFIAEFSNKHKIYQTNQNKKNIPTYNT